MISMPSAAERQRAYYQKKAPHYDEAHLHDQDEHFFALAALQGFIGFVGVKSILDVGAGTGRSLHYWKEHVPGCRVVGVEPSADLREMGYQKGISKNDLIEGDGGKLPFESGEIDLVTCFG